MKKICCIFVVLCILMTQAFTLALADGDVTFNGAADVLSFYDNGLNGGDGSLETAQDGYVVLRPCGEWVSYDVSGLASGTYSVEISYKSTVSSASYVVIDALAGDYLGTRASLAGIGASWSDDPISAELGKIYLDGEGYIKIKNSGRYAIYLVSVTLSFIGAEDTTEAVTVNGQNVSARPDAANMGAVSVIEEDYYDAEIMPEPEEGGYPAGTQFDSEGNAHYPLTDNRIYQSGKLVQHAGDWAKYDISDFRPGTYEVGIRYASRVATNVSLGYTVNAALPATAENYGTYTDLALGSVYIDENAENIIFKNLGSGAIFIDTFSFRFISSERLVFQKYEINAQEVYPGGQGVGFFGNSLNGGTETLEKLTIGSGDPTVVLRQAGEWVKYDVHGFEPGTYKLSLKYTARTETGLYLDVYVDDALASIVKPPKTANSLGGAPETNYVCDVFIPRGAQTVKLVNSSRDATFLSGLVFEYLQKEEPESYNIRKYCEQSTIRDEDGAIIIEEGVDFHDVAGLAYTASGVVASGKLIQHSGDWVRYDVSGMKAGTYALSVRHASTVAASYKFTIAGKSVLRASLPLTGGYSTYNVDSLGKIYIPEGTQYLVMKNLGAGSEYLDYLDFEYEGPEREEMIEEITASSVLPGGQGVGFYDNAAAGTLEISGGSVVLRQNEWVAYDVSELISGTYELIINNSATGGIIISSYVDDNMISRRYPAATGSYGVFEDHSLAALFIAPETQTIKIENTSSAATFLKTVKLKLISTEDLSVSVIEYAGSEIKSQVHGDGFYDGGGEERLELSSGGVVLRTNDWIRYDLAQFSIIPGVYNVKIDASTNGDFTAHISANDMSDDVANPVTGIMENTRDIFDLGNIVITDESEYLHIENKGSNRPIIFKVILESVTEESSIVKFTSDAAGENTLYDLAGQESIYVTVEMTRPKEASFTADIGIAVYESGRLVSFDIVPIEAQYVYKDTFLIEEGLSDFAAVKVFMWESITNGEMQPIDTQGEIQA